MKKYDIVFLSETHLSNDDSFNPRTLGFSVCYRSDRNTSGRRAGGVLVFVNSSTKPRISLCKTFSDNEQLYISVDNSVILGGIYIPPRPYSIDIDERFSILQNNIQQISATGLPLLLFGDFNARIGTCSIEFSDCSEKTSFSIDNIDKTRNRSGSILRSICSEEHLRILNGTIIPMGYTCIRPKGTSVIDFCLSSPSLVDRVFDGKVVMDAIFSDHCLISLKLLSISTATDTSLLVDTSVDSNLNRKRMSKRAINGLLRNTYRRIDLDNDIFFHPTVQRTSYLLEHAKLNHIPLTKEAISSLTDDLLEAASSILYRYVGCKSSFARKPHGHKRHPWNDEECKSLARRFHQKRRINSIRRTSQSYAELYFARRAYQTTYRRKRRAYEQQFLNSLFFERNTRNLWRLVHEKQTHGYNGTVSPESYTDYLSSIASGKFPCDINLLQSAKSSNDIAWQKIPSQDDMKAIGSLLEDMDKKMWILGKNKSPGPDGLSSEVIQLLFPSLFDILENLFLCIYLSGETPCGWDCDIKVPVVKPGKSGSRPNELRPITLVNCLTKIYERFLLNILHTYFTTSENQAGFKQNYGCIQRVFCLNSLITSCMYNKEVLYCVFIDFSSFFDTVQVDILLDYLYKNNVLPSLCRAIHSMFRNLSARVRMKNILGTEFRVNVGIRQGSVISPFLGTAYLEQLSEALAKDNESTRLASISIDHILYADDMAIFSTNLNSLQRKIDSLNSVCESIGLNINTSKTFWTAFCKKKPRGLKDIHINGDTIQYVKTPKYLGVHISEKADFQEHIKLRSNKSNRALAICINFQRRYPSIQFPLILSLYEKMVVPSLLYGSEVYGWKNAECLATVAYRHLKRYFSLPKQVSREALYWALGLLPIQFDVWKQSYKFWQQVTSLPKERLEKSALDNTKSLWAKGDKNWFSDMLGVFDQIGFEGDFENWTDKDIDSNMMTFIDRLKFYLISDMRNKLLESKYSFLLSVFPEFKKRLFLEYTNLAETRVFLRILLSFHPFEIETGRHFGIDRPIRYCKSCMLQYRCVIGDELHHIVDCPQHASYRKTCCDTLSIRADQIVESLNGSLYLDVSVRTRIATICKYFAVLCKK